MKIDVRQEFPEVIPETEEERILNETAPGRAMIRKERKEQNKALSKYYLTALNYSSLK